MDASLPRAWMCWKPGYEDLAHGPSPLHLRSLFLDAYCLLGAVCRHRHSTERQYSHPCFGRRVPLRLYWRFSPPLSFVLEARVAPFRVQRRCISACSNRAMAGDTCPYLRLLI